MIDTYPKVLLTVIAVSLVTIVFKLEVSQPAHAFLGAMTLEEWSGRKDLDDKWGDLPVVFTANNVNCR